MKKMLVIITMLLFSSAGFCQLTKAEKTRLANHLDSTLQVLSRSVEGLSEAQLNFKPDTGKWSIKECVYHLALSETNIWQWMQGLMKAPANPDKRASIKMADDQLLAGIADRSNKIKTSEPFEPKNAKWANKDEAMAFLKAERAKHIDYIKSSNEDFRNHVAEQGPAGPMDAYQVLLLLSQHTVRHTKQIEEVKASPGYPAS
ncbi:MAG: DinB family protein [Ferruginibacter sp.]|nr:DinB family protein [Ferruginibacter sp.]